MEQIIIEIDAQADFHRFAESQIRSSVPSLSQTDTFYWESIGGDEWAVFTHPEDDDLEEDERQMITVRISSYQDQDLLIIEF